MTDRVLETIDMLVSRGYSLTCVDGMTFRQLNSFARIAGKRPPLGTPL